MSRRRRRRNRNRQKPVDIQPVSPRFGTALERYIYQRIDSVQKIWPWVGTALILIILLTSIIDGYFRPNLLSGNVVDAAQVAARAGDYDIARSLYENGDVNRHILGVDTQLEEMIYPERRLTREITTYEHMNITYPHSVEILTILSHLYAQTGNADKAREYLEYARLLDPNNEIFRK